MNTFQIPSKVIDALESNLKKPYIIVLGLPHTYSYFQIENIKWRPIRTSSALLKLLINSKENPDFEIMENFVSYYFR